MDSGSQVSLSKQNHTHGGAEKPRIKMQLYKTEPCQNWSLYGTCRYGNLCKFAHGMTEQRSRVRHPKYKTSLCKDFPLGNCSFGVRCNFAHSLEELRMSAPKPPRKDTPPRVIIQTPVTVLTDGRMLSTFMPVGISSNTQSAQVTASPGELRNSPSHTALSTADRLSPTHHAAPHKYNTIDSSYAGLDGRERTGVARRVASLSQLQPIKHRGGLASVMGSAFVAAPHRLSPPLSVGHSTPKFSSPAPSPSLSLGAFEESELHNEWVTRVQPRRTLTSSVSMQTLPKMAAQAIWDTPASSSSEATLADTDLWSVREPTAQYAQPHESRFFPSPDHKSLTVGYSGGRHVELGDEWVRASAYPSPLSSAQAFFSEPTVLNAPGSGGHESRALSLEQLRAATTTRRNFAVSQAPICL